MDCSHTIDNVYIQKIIQFTQNPNSYGLMVLRKSIETKKIDNKFKIYWYDRLLVIDKKVMSVVDLNKNQYKFATSIDIKNVVNLFFFFFSFFFVYVLLARWFLTPLSNLYKFTLQLLHHFILCIEFLKILKHILSWFQIIKKPKPKPKLTKPQLSQKKKNPLRCRIDYLGVLIK